MNTEGAVRHIRHDIPDASFRNDDQSELPARAAEAATELYATHEHEQRRRRFELALMRAADAER
ncbi:MAG: hypothetical protein Q7U89_04140 [Coriobacteriia bacterium]|nr:hypothetical protein [Coriobacteriia bacterium]